MNIKELFLGSIRSLGIKIFRNWECRKEVVEVTEKTSSFKKKGDGVVLSLPLFLYGQKYTEIGNNVTSCAGLRIECIDFRGGYRYSPTLMIGNRVTFGFYDHIGCINKIIIGDDVLIGSHVLITDHSHGKLEKSQEPYNKRKLISKGPVIIEDNVWIGENACILPGVRIGTGCIIGANAVVTKDIPPYSVAVGVPAKVVKTLE